MKHIGQHQLGAGHADGLRGSDVMHSHNPVSDPLTDGLVIEAVEIELVFKPPLGDIQQQRIEKLPVFLQHFFHHLDRHPQHRGPLFSGQSITVLLFTGKIQEFRKNIPGLKISMAHFRIFSGVIHCFQNSCLHDAEAGNLCPLGMDALGSIVGLSYKIGPEFTVSPAKGILQDSPGIEKCSYICRLQKT